jgi:hypothetical protein
VKLAMETKPLQMAPTVAQPGFARERAQSCRSAKAKVGEAAQQKGYALLPRQATHDGLHGARTRELRRGLSRWRFCSYTESGPGQGVFGPLWGAGG